MCFNSELKEINVELSKYNISENAQNWKALVKATGEFHRNYRAFYMMVVFFSYLILSLVFVLFYCVL